MKKKLPANFRHLLWSYDFAKINPVNHKKTIIVNVISYGDLPHWRWLINYYGLNTVKEVLQQIPQTNLRPSLQKLLEVVFEINFKYAHRGSHKGR